jgi:hypothetical protein
MNTMYIMHRNMMLLMHRNMMLFFWWMTHRDSPWDTRAHESVESVGE